MPSPLIPATARARESRKFCQKQFLAENRNAAYSGPHENPGSRPAVCGKEQRGARFDRIGVGSISIVLSACFFIGVALALNSATTLGQFGARSLIGELVSIGVIREARHAGYKPAKVAITIAVTMLAATSAGVRSSLSSNRVSR